MWKRKNESLFYHILLFSIAQFAWCLLLGLWIFWYVTTYIRTDAFTNPASLPFNTAGNAAVLVSGIILLVTLSTILSLIFAYLAKQMNITGLYDNFISNITHELKSPLSAIQLYLETMRKRDIDRKKKEEFIGYMLEDVERLNKLINSVLYLSTMRYSKTARKMVHDYHIYNADSIIRDVISETASGFRLAPESLSVEGKATGRCVVDRKWLSIVFSNLIDNAIKYTPGKPLIEVRLGGNKRQIIVEVADNGIGIEKKDISKLFRRFVRLENPLSPNVRGTGLGLYRVKEIVKYHGGNITAKSGGKGEGTAFIITLPVYKTHKKCHVNRLLKLSRLTASAKSGE